MKSTGCIRNRLNRLSLSKIILLLSVISLRLVSSSSAQDPNDPGQPDTIWIDCGTKAVHDSGGWVAYTVYLKTDNQGVGNDIAGVDLPLYISRTNTNDTLARFDTTVSLVFANSVFNGSGAFLSVTVDSVELDGSLKLGAVNFDSTGPQNGTYVLARLWIHLSDSTTLTIDTVTSGGNSLQLVTSNAVGYVPIWKKATCNVCVHTSPPGDAACNGGITLSDVIFLVNYIFKQGPLPCCKVLGDANCSGGITLSDIIFLVNYIFKSGQAPQYCP